MNWGAISAVAEILAAVGVIATLVYLAVQIRQNSQMMERNTEATQVIASDAVTANFNEWREMVITNPEVSEIFVRGMEDLSTLDANDRHRFNHILATFAWTAWQLWRAEGLIGNPNTLLLRHMLLHPGGRAWYMDHGQFFPPEFKESIDNHLRDIEESGTPFLSRADVSSMFAGVIEVERHE